MEIEPRFYLSPSRLLLLNDQQQKSKKGKAGGGFGCCRQGKSTQLNSTQLKEK